jgi:nicotinate-nucleotide pyrophosphorylase
MGHEMGGGENHRFALYDMIMLKTTILILQAE